MVEHEYKTPHQQCLLETLRHQVRHIDHIVLIFNDVKAPRPKFQLILHFHQLLPSLRRFPPNDLCRPPPKLNDLVQGLGASPQWGSRW
jgi:hypothetical protein